MKFLRISAFSSTENIHIIHTPPRSPFKCELLIYRRCPAHIMTGMPDEQARQFLAYIEEDFNIVLDDIVRNKLLSRIHQIKRGGLGVAIDILFRTMLVEVPGMKQYYQALINDIDREDALRYIKHKDPIHISEGALMGAMSMQR